MICILLLIIRQQRPCLKAPWKPRIVSVSRQEGYFFENFTRMVQPHVLGARNLPHPPDHLLLYYLSFAWHPGYPIQGEEKFFERVTWIWHPADLGGETPPWFATYLGYSGTPCARRPFWIIAGDGGVRGVLWKNYQGRVITKVSWVREPYHQPPCFLAVVFSWVSWMRLCTKAQRRITKKHQTAPLFPKWIKIKMLSWAFYFANFCENTLLSYWFYSQRILKYNLRIWHSVW